MRAKRVLALFVSIAASSMAPPPVRAATLKASPADYRTLVRTLKPGDTLQLVPGSYPRLNISNLNGTEDAWITISGPLSGPPAVIRGEPEYNTISIHNSSYVAIENLTINSRGIAGAFGIAAHGLEDSRTHNIRVEGNTFIGQHGGQQTVAISTKTPTWGWIIRNNQILGAGTGMYLGNSDGSQPFVAGLIENNLIRDTIGYNLQIKHQIALPPVDGLPVHPTVTIIRNNVFIKNDQPSPDGDRPNVLLGAFPATGPGSLNMYEVYGNYFLHNHREALFQASGRVTVHDNVFVDGSHNYPTVVFRNHEGPLKVVHVYNNTIYTNKEGVYFGSRALIDDAVIGNLVFAITPISGSIMRQSGNIVDLPANAAKYVRSPSAEPGVMDFYPLPGKCQGPSIDLSDFHSQTDFGLDFNGTLKALEKRAVTFRGAYAGEGDNPGWKLNAAIKHPYPPYPAGAPALVSASPAVMRAGSTRKVSLTGFGFSEKAIIEVSGQDVRVANPVVDGGTRITLTISVGPSAALGERSIAVRSPSGASNPLVLRVVSK